MGIIKDHSITKTLKDGNLRNDPEVLDLICDVLNGLDDDIEELGGLKVSKKTDNSLEMLNTAIIRVEDELDSDEDSDENEDEYEELEEEIELEDDEVEFDEDEDSP